MKTADYGGHDPSCLMDGVVAKVKETYFVAYPTMASDEISTRDSITVSLEEWKGDAEPQPGQRIVLVNTMLYQRGWRASEAYPIKITRS